MEKDAITIIQDIIKDEKERIKDRPLQLELLGSFGREWENAHSSIIAKLLGEEEYLKLFLKTLKPLDIDKDLSKASVKTEHYTVELEGHSYKRIDIFIKINDETCIIIENKIKANDQLNQLQNYSNYAEICGFKNIYMLYLTKDGKKASSYSSGSLSGDKVTNISYRTHILQWLDSIYEKLDYNGEQKILKSAIEQYRYSIKILTNHTQKLICVGIKKYFGVEASYILSLGFIHELQEKTEEEFFKSIEYVVPYFTGVLLKDKGLVIVFLNDGYDQYQIWEVEKIVEAANSISLKRPWKKQGYGNDLEIIIEDIEEFV